MTREANIGGGLLFGFSKEASRAQMMAEFDRLPPRHRRLAREAPYNVDVVGFERRDLNELRMTLAYMLRESARLTYGDEHPQARRKTR